MPLKVFLCDPLDGEPVDVVHVQTERGKENVLAIGTLANINGTFKSTSFTVAGTYAVTTPILGQSITLTDMIISADKKNTGKVTVRFTDGTNTVNIFEGTVTDAPINLAIPFTGRWTGWVNARIEVVVVQNVIGTVAVGYYKVPEGLPFAEWDSRR